MDSPSLITRRLRIVLAVGTLALAGCADAESPGSGDSVEEVDACALLTDAQVSSILGGPLREPRADEPTSYSLGACNWSDTDGDRGLYVSARALDQWESGLEINDFGVEPVDGLGERAHRTFDNGLFVDPGDRPYFYQLFVIGTDGSVSYDLTVEAAQLLLE